MADTTPSELDITALLTENQRRARLFGRKKLLLVVSATHCPGCETLADQLGRREIREVLHKETYLVKIEAGDLYEAVAGSLRVGDWTLSLPGFPITWTWEVKEDGLVFHALGIGPLEEAAPLSGINDLLAGRSVWVPEAEGARVLVCRKDFCATLTAENGFSYAFDLNFPATRE
ncbi:MAG: hypothetical protein VX498_04340 [Myxococcota bacterium]|nr:hypothetical protein [Myxococcota bacterium]